MLRMSIGKDDGTILLPNGHSIPPSLSQDAFRQTALFQQSRAQDYGTLPWIHYHFSGGLIDERELLTSLCFYDQLFVQAMLTIDLYTKDQHDWSHYSLDFEAATKECHDRLLKELLGSPTKVQRLSIGGLSPSQSTLARPLTWSFPWGCVSSGHDFKGGGTQIGVVYGDRFEEANREYRSQTK